MEPLGREPQRPADADGEGPLRGPAIHRVRGDPEARGHGPDVEEPLLRGSLRGARAIGGGLEEPGDRAPPVRERTAGQQRPGGLERERGGLRRVARDRLEAGDRDGRRHVPLRGAACPAAVGRLGGPGDATPPSTRARPGWQPARGGAPDYHCRSPSTCARAPRHRAHRQPPSGIGVLQDTHCPSRGAGAPTLRQRVAELGPSGSSSAASGRRRRTAPAWRRRSRLVDLPKSCRPTPPLWRSALGRQETRHRNRNGNR